MKVLLIAPYLDDNNKKRNDFLPSGALLCLASVLRKNSHTPILLDFNNKETYLEKDSTLFCHNKILTTIEKENPDFIGISCLFSGFFETVSGYAKLIKKQYASLKIVTGGIHVTTYPKEILENCHEFDYIVLGEGESQVVELTKCIEQKQLDSLNDIKSFAYRDSNNIVHINEEREWLVTSGSLLDLNVFKEIGEFDENLFIDYVDTDYCIRLRKSGYKLIQFARPIMMHSLGITKDTLGYSFYEHSPIRNYYIFRNKLYILTKYFSMKRLFITFL